MCIHFEKIKQNKKVDKKGIFELLLVIYFNREEKILIIVHSKDKRNEEEDEKGYLKIVF